METIASSQVSCVIPYAGAEKYLEEVVGSASSQHFGEIVIVNDGFPPEQLSVVAKAPSVRIIHVDKSIGCANARNLGIKACKLPYVVLLDHDDVLCEGYLGAITAWVANNKLRCAAATLRYIGEDSKRIGVVVSRAQNFVLPSGFLSEVSLIAEAGYFPDSYSDDILFFRGIRAVTKLTTCPSAQVLYRIHPQAESSRNAKVWWAFNQLLPLYSQDKLTLTQINSMARDFATTGVVPTGMESRFSGVGSVSARFLARSAYACWLNRDFGKMARYGVRLLAYLPEIVRLAQGKWRRPARQYRVQGG